MWSRLLLSYAAAIAPLFLAIVTAATLLAGRAGGHLETAAALATPRVRRWPYLAAHGVAVILFWQLTAYVFEGEGSRYGAIVAAWAVLGLLVVTSLVPLVTGGVQLRRIGRLLWRLALLAAVVGALAWGAGQLTASWWQALRHGTFTAVVTLLHVIVEDAFARPDKYILGTRRFWVEIAPGCSGYEGIGLISVFLAAYLWLFRDTLRFPRAFLLLPLGAVAALGANVLRITALVLVGTFWSPEVALGGFHSYLGSLLFCVLALGIAILANRSRMFSRQEPAHPRASAAESSDITAAYLGPLLAILAVTLMTGVVSSDALDRLYPLRVLAAAAVLWACRHRYREIRWTASGTAIVTGVAVFVLWLALEPPLPDLQRRAEIAEGLAGLSPLGAAVWLIARVLGAVVLVPIAEELAFRGYVCRRVLGPDVAAISLARFSWRGLLVSSLLFGLLHQQLVAGTLAGLAYGLVLYRRGQLGDAILAHAITNALLAGWVLGTGSWELW